MPEAYEQRNFVPPAGATDVLVVRHGASKAFVPGEPVDVLSGQDDPPLSPAGERQAEALAARLARVDVDRLFTTSLKRTQQTAAPLTLAHGLQPEAIDDLREVGLGAWEQGELRVRAHARDPIAVRLWTEQRWDVIPGAETNEAFAERVARGFERVLRRTGPDATAVLVVHGGVIAELCRQLTDSRPFAFLNADNASITRVVVLADGRRLLRGFNDTAHLGG